MIPPRQVAMCAGVYRDYADAAAQAVWVEHRYTPDAPRLPYYQARSQLHQRLTDVLREAWGDMVALDA